MRALSASELLSIWERGPTQNPVQRALTLLNAAHPEVSAQELAQLCIGRRNALLLTLREWTFGPRLSGMAACASCGERLEMEFNVSDIRVAEYVIPEESLSLSADGYDVKLRLPNSVDLIAILEDTEVAAARRTLLERCILSVFHDSEKKAADQLPEHILDMIAERMEQADPQADIQLSLSCPACGLEWQAAFDIVQYFWNEINSWAQHTLRGIHTLASAYGWREADILAIAPWRRQLYLEMINR